MERAAPREARSLLLGGAAHELNNIFAQTLLLAEVLATADLDPELAGMLESLQRSVQRGINVVGRLVEQSHLAPGEPIRLDPRHLVSAVHKRSEGLIGEDVLISHRYPETVFDIQVEPQGLLDTILELCRATAVELVAGGHRPRVDVLVTMLEGSPGRKVCLGVTAPPSLIVEGGLEPCDALDLDRYREHRHGGLLEGLSAAAGRLGASCRVMREGPGIFLALVFDAIE